MGFVQFKLFNGIIEIYPRVTFVDTITKSWKY